LKTIGILALSLTLLQYPTLELSLFSKIPQVHDKGKWKLTDEHDVES
jgi:hypothetical protein